MGLLNGALAGAAGTTALNAVTFLDMTVRGRPSSQTPEQMVEKTGIPIPGAAEERRNRLTGLGSLAGLGVGTGIGILAGAVYALGRRFGVRAPLPVGAAAVGVSAMALTDVPMALSGVTDPREWSATDWASDLLPHLAYGLVTYAVLRAADD